MDKNNGTPKAAQDNAREYQELKKALEPHNDLMRKAADTVLDQEVSKYPIFVVHRAAAIELGVPIIQHEPTDEFSWSVNISTLEEFAAKKVIDIARVDRFQQVYKDPKEHFCLFLLKQEGANFVFL